MCDDNWDDWDGLDDGFYDPDNESNEDMAEGFDDSCDRTDNKHWEKNNFDLIDTMIIGSMIAGCAYDEALEKRRIKEEKDKK